MEYDIIAIQGAPRQNYTEKLGGLEEAVTLAIARGWVPLGPVSITVFPAGFLFAQTLIRTKVAAG